LLASIQHLTVLDAKPPTKQRRVSKRIIEQTLLPLLVGQLNGPLAYRKITAIELWRKIAEYL
jgi:hypothetical protein